MKDKIVILGARSGTSLMLNCLAATGKFVVWSQVDGHASEIHRCYKDQILASWGLVTVLPSDWTLAKAPEFDYCIPSLIAQFKPKFIVLDRCIEGVVNSMVNTKSGDAYLNWAHHELRKIEQYPRLAHAVESLYYIPAPSVADMERRIVLFQRIEREKGLAGYPADRILRVDFDEFMRCFKTTMYKVGKFCGFEPRGEDITRWVEMRKKQWMPSAHDISRWVDGEAIL